MTKDMIYNPGVYQFREEALQRMLRIIQNQTKAKPGGIVFYGDSITEMYELDVNFPERLDLSNCGIGGMVANGLCEFVDEAVVEYNPSKVVVMIGVNDLGNSMMSSPKQIIQYVDCLTKMILNNCEGSEVLLVSTLPCIEALQAFPHVKGIRSNGIIQILNQQYQELIKDSRITYIHAYPSFVNEDGSVREELYRDGLHLNAEGYQVLSSILTKYL